MSKVDQSYLKEYRVFTSAIITSVILTVSSHSVPQCGKTALMEASVSGHTDVVQLLLSSGSQVDLQDKVRHNINYMQ